MKFGKIGVRSPMGNGNIASSYSGTDIAASLGDDMTGSKSLTDLADLPVPFKQTNKIQAVTAWKDDGLIEDWNFDDLASKDKKPSPAKKAVWEPPKLADRMTRQVKDDFKEPQQPAPSAKFESKEDSDYDAWGGWSDNSIDP